MTATLGIGPRFPSIKSYLKSYVLALDKPAENVTRLAAYGAGRPVNLQSASSNEPEVYGVLDAMLGLTHVAVDAYWHSIQGALSGAKDWETTWRKAVAYQYWSIQSDHAWHLQALDEFKHGKRAQKLRMLYLRDFGFCLGNCLALGWFDWSRHLAGSAFGALNDGMLSDGRSDWMPSRIQYFVLRLLCDWQDWPTRVPEACAYDEPLYESLLQEWRSSPEDGAISPLLLAACDRHTHQARVNTNKATFDLPYHEMWYVPFEILSVLRLRETLELPLPQLQHPLMNTPLGRLPAKVAPYTDDLLQAVLPRVAAQIPQFQIE